MNSWPTWEKKPAKSWLWSLLTDKPLDQWFPHSIIWPGFNILFYENNYCFTSHNTYLEQISPHFIKMRWRFWFWTAPVYKCSDQTIFPFFAQTTQYRHLLVKTLQVIEFITKQLFIQQKTYSIFSECPNKFVGTSICIIISPYMN